MQSNQFRRTRVAAAVAGLALALGASQAFGAGFALQEQNGSGLGNAFAGGAASAEDASTVWANPAGMSRFKTIQVVAAGNLLMTSNKFSNDGSLPAANQPLGGNGGNAGITALVPAMYVVVPINEQFAFGLGIGAPFGLETDWDGGWLGRYQALNSKIETLNVNPAFSWKINESFTVAAGANWQKLKVPSLTSNANYGGLVAGQCVALPSCQPFAAQVAGALYGQDAGVKLDGEADAWGWNIGVMWNVSPDMRIGAHYRSSIKFDVSGNVDFTLPTVPKTGNAQLDAVVGLLTAGASADPRLQDGGVTSSVEVPSFTNVSFFSRINPQWEVMADVQYTTWSTVQDLTFTRTTGAVLQSTPENFKDVWRVSAGANYIVDSEWKLRGGLAWDQSPVNDTDRTPRLPDADRFWVAAGAQYTYAKQWKFDVGLAYIWAQNASSNQNAGSTLNYGLVKGSYDNSVLIVGGQVAYSF